jgi:hypothetical protein
MTPMRNGREGDGPPSPSVYSSGNNNEIKGFQRVIENDQKSSSIISTNCLSDDDDLGPYEDLNRAQAHNKILQGQLSNLSAECDAWQSQAQRFMKERDSARLLLYEVTSDGQITLDSLLDAKWQIRELLSVVRAAVSWREFRKCSSHEIEVAQRDHLKDVVDALHPDALEEPNDG